MENICWNASLEVWLQLFLSICNEVVKDQKSIMQLIFTIFMQMFVLYDSIDTVILLFFVIRRYLL